MVNIRVVATVLTYAVCLTPAVAADRLELVSLEDEILPEPRVTAEAVFVGLVG